MATTKTKPKAKAKKPEPIAYDSTWTDRCTSCSRLMPSDNIELCDGCVAIEKELDKYFPLDLTGIQSARSTEMLNEAFKTEFHRVFGADNERHHAGRKVCSKVSTVLSEQLRLGHRRLLDGAVVTEDGKVTTKKAPTGPKPQGDTTTVAVPQRVVEDIAGRVVVTVEGETVFTRIASLAPAGGKIWATLPELRELFEEAEWYCHPDGPGSELDPATRGRYRVFKMNLTTAIEFMTRKAEK